MNIEVTNHHEPIVGEKYSLGEILTALGVQLSKKAGGLRLVLPPLPPVLCVPLLGNYVAIEGTTTFWPSAFCELSEKHLTTRWVYRGQDPHGAAVFCTMDAERLIRVIEVARYGKDVSGNYTYKVQWKKSTWFPYVDQGKVIDPVIVPFPIENSNI